MHPYLSAGKPRVIPRVLEKQTDERAGYQPALPFQAMPTQRMVRAALLNGWPLNAAQRAEGSAGGNHASGPLLTA
jgi:hypothetical protein